MTDKETSSNLYGFLGRFPKLREWLGDHQAKSLVAHDYAVVNKKWGVLGSRALRVLRDELDRELGRAMTDSKSKPRYDASIVIPRRELRLALGGERSMTDKETCAHCAKLDDEKSARGRAVARKLAAEERAEKAEAERDTLQAACAEMRAALESLPSVRYGNVITFDGGECYTVDLEVIDNCASALSSDAGKDYVHKSKLEEVEVACAEMRTALEWALKEAERLRAAMRDRECGELEALAESGRLRAENVQLREALEHFTCMRGAQRSHCLGCECGGVDSGGLSCKERLDIADVALNSAQAGVESEGK